jgi:hypothetical protein
MSHLRLRPTRHAGALPGVRRRAGERGSMRPAVKRRLIRLCSVGAWTTLAVVLAYGISLLWLNGGGRAPANPSSMLANVASAVETWEKERAQGQLRGRTFGSVLVAINRLRGVGKTVTRGYVESVMGAPDLTSVQQKHTVVVYLTDGVAPQSTAWVVVYDPQGNLADVFVNNSDAFGADFWSRFSQSLGPSSAGAPAMPPAR